MTKNRQNTATKAAAKTKKARVLALMRRKSGATLDQLAKATGWQVHSIRAAITRLRQAWCPIQRTGKGKTGRYRISDAPKAA